MCAPGAFRYLGTQCVTTCPPDYIGDKLSGLCLKRNYGPYNPLCNKKQACTDEEVCFNNSCHYVQTMFLGVKVTPTNMLLLEFSRPVKMTSSLDLESALKISLTLGSL